MRIKVMPDYECPCVWWDGEPGRVGPIEHRELDISAALVADLDAWAADFDATLNRADPIRSGFASTEEEEAFLRRGRDLVARLADELGPTASVRYWHGS